MDRMLLKTAEAAAALGMSESTLKKLVKLRKVPFTRPAGTTFVRFSEHDINEIIAAGRQAPERPLSSIRSLPRPRASKGAA